MNRGAGSETQDNPYQTAITIKTNRAPHCNPLFANYSNRVCEGKMGTPGE